MTFKQIVSSINSLSPGEQMRVVNAIWDRLPNDVGAILQDNEAAILNQRWQKYLNDPTTAVSEQDFRSALKEQRKK